MLQTRRIPCLLLRRAGFVKTVRFKDPTYLGDPLNIVKIFNDKEVDEAVILDIEATVEGREPPYDFLYEIAGEAFMPMGYGGGIRSREQAERVLKLGYEKVCINSAAIEDPKLIGEVARAVGSQSVVVSIDARRTLFGGYQVYTHGGRKKAGVDPVELARRCEDLGAGEILITSIDRDGTMEGYDLTLTRKVTDAVQIPVVACGGAGHIDHFSQVVHEAGASAVSAGSFFVFKGPLRGVLISFPSEQEWKQALAPQQPGAQP